MERKSVKKTNRMAESIIIIIFFSSKINSPNNTLHPPDLTSLFFNENKNNFALKSISAHGRQLAIHSQINEWCWWFKNVKRNWTIALQTPSVLKRVRVPTMFVCYSTYTYYTENELHFLYAVPLLLLLLPSCAQLLLFMIIFFAANNCHKLIDCIRSWCAER